MPQGLTSELKVSGEVIKSLIKEADYQAANGRAVEITFPAITGFTIGVATGRLVFDDGTSTVTITAVTIVDNADGTWTAKFDIVQANTSATPAGAYPWQAEISEASIDVMVGRSFNVSEYITFVEKLT